MAGYGTVMFFLALGVLASIRGDRTSMGDFNIPVRIAVFVYALLCAGTIVLHEAVHGLFFRLFGGRPRYGVGVAYWFLPYAYATSPERYSMEQMATIGLAPLVIISCACLISMVLAPTLSDFAIVAFITNFCGAIGDVWVVREMARFWRCRNVWTVDAKDGLEIHTADPIAQQIVQRLAARDERIKTNLIGWWLGSSMALVMTSLPLTILLTELKAAHVLIGPPQFPLFVYERTPDSFGISIDFRVVVVAGFLLAVLRILFDRRKSNLGGAKGETTSSSHRPAFL
jgi:hypothetical protein